MQKGRIVAALRNAIVNNYEGFEVNYQPIVDCQTEQIIGAEALMRFSMITEEGRELFHRWSLSHCWKRPD